MTTISLGAFASKNPNTPANLGNVQLQVTGFEKTGKDYDSVVGKVLNPKPGAPAEMTIRLMSAERANNILKAEKGVAHFEERYSNRPAVSEYVEGKYAVPVGGVISMQDVRRDFSDNKFYAQRMYSMITKPLEESLVQGYTHFKHFPASGERGDDLKINMFQPEKAFRLTPENAQLLQKAFDPNVFQHGEAVRQALVTIKAADGYMTSVVRSGFEKTDDGYNVLKDIRDTLRQISITSKRVAVGAVAVAGVMGLGVNDVNIDIDLAPDEVNTFNEVNAAVERGELEVSLTPGYQFGTYKDKVAELLERSRMFGNREQNGEFRGKGFTPASVSVRHVRSGSPDEAYDQPMVTNFQADGYLAPAMDNREGFFSFNSVGEMGHENLYSADNSPKLDNAPQISAVNFDVSTDQAPAFD